MLSKLKTFITGTRDEVKAATSEFDKVAMAFAEAAAECQALQAEKFSLDMIPEGQHQSESREQHARRLWENKAKRREIVQKIGVAEARRKELEAEINRLRAERDRASGVAVLAESSSDAAQALSELDSARNLVKALEAKAVEAKGTGEALTAERAEIALAAHSGDAAAAVRLGEINQQIVMHAVETDGLCAAIDQAKRNVETAKAGAARLEGLRKASEARRVADLILEQSAAVDRAAAEMAAALRRREELKFELRKTGGMENQVINRVTSGMCVNRALAAAGIGHFAVLDRGGSSAHWTPLAQHDAAILGRPVRQAPVAA